MKPVSSRAGLDRVGTAAFAIYVFSIAAYAAIKPHYNWDIVAYIGSAYRWSEPDIAVVHAKTFEVLQRDLPAKAYEKLTAGPFAAAVAGDPAIFAEHIRMSQLKPGYIALIRALMLLGLSPVTATIVIAIASCVSIALLIYRWLTLHHRPIVAALLGAFLLNASSLPVIAQIATADALSASIVLLAFYELIEHDRETIGLALLASSILVRVDNVVLAEALALYLTAAAMRERSPWIGHAAMAVAIPVLYLGVGAVLGGIGWSSAFVRSFTGRLYPDVMTLPIYAHAVAGGLRDLLAPQPAFFMLAATLAYVGAGDSPPRGRFLRELLLLLFAVMSLRFFLFPNPGVRLWFAFYLLIGLSLSMVSAGWAGRREPTDA